MTSGYSPLGGMIVRRRADRAVPRGTATFLHGITFAGHPVSCAVALANLDVFEKEDLLEQRPRERGRASAPRSRSCTTCRSSATSAATATSTASSWSRTRPPGRRSTTTSPSGCCAASCRTALFDAGLICRADDRGDPVIQLAPPLICGQEHFDEIEQILREVLTEAWDRI